jgi:hypothetical protein
MTPNPERVTGTKSLGRTAKAAFGPVIRKSVTLDQRTIEFMRELGDGDLSVGIRVAALKLVDTTRGASPAQNGLSKEK